MGERDYGAIPMGLRELPELEDLDDGPRAALMSAWWLADYFGRYPRDPRIFARRAGWPTRPDPALVRLDAHLSELEGLGILESWVGGCDGRAVWVGHIVGYHGFAGLPRDRRDPSRRPKGGSEYPDADPDLAKTWERPTFPPETPGRPVGPLPHQSHTNPTRVPHESRNGPTSLPSDSHGSPASPRANPARSPLV